MAAPSIVDAPLLDGPGVFVSYSRTDTAFVRRLLGALEGSGVRAWVDWEGIPPSAEWWREVERAIEGAEAVLFVISPRSIASTVCGQEIAHALAHNKRLIPIVFGEIDARTMPPTELTKAVSRLNWIFFRDTDDFTEAIARLKAAIETDLDWVREHSRLVERAVEWQSHARDGSFLLQQNDLLAAEAWLAAGPAKDPQPTTLQTEYILAGRAAGIQRRRRILTASAVAAVLILAASLVAGWQALISNVRQEESLSRRLAAQVPQAFDTDAWDLGLLLAVHAYDTAPTVEAQHAMLQGLERVRGTRRMLADRFAADGPLALSADGNLLAALRCSNAAGDSECEPGDLVVTDLARGSQVMTLSSASSVIGAAFDARGTRLAVALDAAPPVIRIVDLASGAPGPIALDGLKSTIPVPGDTVSQIDFVGDNTVAALAGRLIEWRVDTGAITDQRPLSLVALRRDRGAALSLGAAARDLIAATVLSRAEPGAPPPFFPETGAAAVNRTRMQAALVSCMTMASGRHCQGELRLVDLTSGQVIGEIVRNEPEPDSLLDVTFGGDVVIAAGCGGLSSSEACLHGQVRLWRADSISGLEGAAKVRTFGGQVSRLAGSRDGRTFASLSSTGHVTVWNLDATLMRMRSQLPSVLQSPAAARDAAPVEELGCNDVGDRLNLQPVADAAGTLTDRGGICSAIAAGDMAYAWDPNRRLLAVSSCVTATGDTCGAGRLTFWESVDGRLRKVRDLSIDGLVTALGFGPSSRIAIARCGVGLFEACRDGSIVIADQSNADGRVVATGLRFVSALAWDAGGARLAYSTCTEVPASGPPVDNCSASAIQILDVESGTTLDGVLTGHRNSVPSLAFSPDGTLLVSGDQDGNLAFWDTVSRQPLGGMLPSDALPVRSLRFTSATTLRSMTQYATNDWIADPGGWKAIACGLAGRRLTASERQRYIGAASEERDPCAATGPRHGGWVRWLRSIATGG